jgi:RHS repeat-associated protein
VGPDSANNPNQYTSRENDNTGLYYYRARYYDPVMKRFVSSDPIGLAGGINTFAYVGGNPLMYSDPYGLFGMADMPTLPQGMVDGVTGFGDAFLLPELVRDALDIDGGVNQCSAFYRGGKAVGFVVGAVPFSLEAGAALGATKFASVLNKNRYFRIGPGKASAGARFGLSGGRNVPMARIGNGKPSDWNHIDLRSRLPKVAPLGGPGECGCP